MDKFLFALVALILLPLAAATLLFFFQFVSSAMDLLSPETRPAKRIREDDAQTPILRSSEFWLEDGTVLIQASDIQFRVHRGTLSMHSEFFKGLFEIPQPPEQPTIEGCPVVEVTDPSEDWVALLKMVYRPLEVMQQSFIPYSFYASALRLGKKYEFKTVAQTALSELKTRFKDPKICITQGPFRTILPVIEVVEELRIDVLRPALYYWCLRHMSPIHIANGVESVEDDVKTHLHLPDTFRNVLIIYRDAVRHTLISKVWLPLYKTRAACQKVACYEKLLQHVTNILATPVRLSSLERSSVEGLCAVCTSHVSQSVNTALDAFFKLLPICFGMEKFDDLADYAE